MVQAVEGEEGLELTAQPWSSSSGVQQSCFRGDEIVVFHCNYCLSLMLDSGHVKYAPKGDSETVCLGRHRCDRWIEDLFYFSRCVVEALNISAKLTTLLAPDS